MKIKMGSLMALKFLPFRSMMGRLFLRLHWQLRSGCGRERSRTARQLAE
jgi:hypothetical protein